jgi:hypothetical protein
MDELETLISGDMVGAPVSQDDLALARALVNSGIAGEIDIVGDDMMDDDVVGAEIEIVGADPAPSTKVMQKPKRRVSANQLRSIVQKSAMKMASQMMHQGRGGGGQGSPVAVERQQSGETETAYLAMFRDQTNGGLILGNQEVDVVGEPQKPFRPEALVLDDETARDFLILDIKIGTDSFFVNSGPIPASQFTADAVLNALRTRTGQTSQQITIRVRNRTPDNKAFYASFKGSKAK